MKRSDHPAFGGSDGACLDAIEAKYLRGYADLMLSAPYSIDGDTQSLEALSELGFDIAPLISDLHSAYLSSALSGSPVRIDFGEDPDHPHLFTWVLEGSLSFRDVATKPGPDSLRWKAVEDLPRWRTHYARYSEAISALPSLLSRLELVTIEDQDINRRTGGFTDAQIAQVASSESELVGKALRNDGFLLHGPARKVQVFHRNADQVISGIKALKDDALAATDYPEGFLWGKSEAGGGLAGIDRRDRDRLSSGTMLRLMQTWQPVIQASVDYLLGTPDTELRATIRWGSPVVEPESEMIQSDLTRAQAAKIWVELGIYSPEEIRARLDGGTMASRI